MLFLLWNESFSLYSWARWSIILAHWKGKKNFEGHELNFDIENFGKRETGGDFATPTFRWPEYGEEFIFCLYLWWSFAFDMAVKWALDKCTLASCTTLIRCWIDHCLVLYYLVGNCDVSKFILSFITSTSSQNLPFIALIRFPSVC